MIQAAAESRQFFERLIAGGQGDATAYLGLATACARLGDHHAAITAADRLLTLQPRNVRALILKADQLAALGDVRAASAFYRSVVDFAPPEREMPAELRDDVRRAAALCKNYAAAFETYLRQRLPAAQGSRFGESLDILVGKKNVFFQQPRQYFFPGLPQIQFYPREALPWLERLEAATHDIRSELLRVLQEDTAFHPYVERNARLPHVDALGLLDNPAWSAFDLWRHGEPVAENAARCPKTMAALAEVPLALVKGRSPSVIFSLLKPGAHIPPHTGEVNTRLICHLPLIVPPNCALRVGNDTRAVVEGKAWVFDDTIEHEAWNRSDQTRVILLFEVWRPELTDEERGLVRSMFEAIEDYR
jgi:aspartyl/asparaginyl beta-hydroxylase (cupin superfamily)